MERFPDGRAVLLVDKHKSSATHGPASLPLAKEIVEGLDLYVSEYRAKLTGGDPQLLFRSAKPHVDMQLQKLAEAHGLEGLAGKLTPTMLRKVAGTTARSTLAEKDCEKLANMMCHQPDTQRRHYAAKQRNSANLEVSQMMEAHLFGRPGQPQAQPSASESGQPQAQPSTSESGQPQAQTSMSESGQPQAQPSTSGSGRMARKPFTDDEMAALAEAARESRTWNMDQVLTLRDRYPALANRSAKVIYNKLRELNDAQKRTRRWLLNNFR